MKTVFLLLFTIALGGCCAAEKCDCPNQAAADDIVLRFSRDTLSTPATGFTRAETSRMLLIRTPIDRMGGAKADTLYYPNYQLPAAGEPDFLLRRDRPFPRSVIGLNGYRYSVVLLRKPGRPPLQRFELRDVLLESGYETASPCCTCYENRRKELRLDQGPVLDLRTPPGSQPIVVELRKL